MSAETTAKNGGRRDVETSHEYDGIREFDNPLPLWWLVTLWAAVFFGMGYWVWAETLGHGGTRAAYEAELSVWERQVQGPSASEEELLALAADPAAIERGRALFQTNCLACHGAKGQGLIGPNLTDDFWKNGRRPTEIYRTIGQGVVTKGMQAWRPILGDAKVRDVLAFTLSIRDTKVKGRHPEGVDADGRAAPPAPLAPLAAPAEPAAR